MRLSLVTALGIAAFLGIVAIDAPDANAQARRAGIAGGANRTAFVAGRAHRAAFVRGGRRTAFVGRRGRVAFATRGLRGARGAVVCRTVWVNGVRVRRCGAIWRR